MVVSAADDKVLDIAVRKIRQLKEKNSELRTYVGRLNMHEAALRLQETYETPKPRLKVSTKMSGCPSASCIGESVIDILVRRPELFSFEEACAILSHCNIDQHMDFVKDTIRKYAIVIIGMPECDKKDLPLAVFFFLEDMFGIQAKLQFCVNVTEEYETNSIGVVFDDIVTKQKIAKKLDILDGTDIEIDTYCEVNWILDYLCSD